MEKFELLQMSWPMEGESALTLFFSLLLEGGTGTIADIKVTVPYDPGQTLGDIEKVGAAALADQVNRLYDHV